MLVFGCVSASEWPAMARLEWTRTPRSTTGHCVHTCTLTGLQHTRSSCVISHLKVTLGQSVGARLRHHLPDLVLSHCTSLKKK